MSKSTLIIEENNLSHAWGRAFLSITEHGVQEVSPLVVTVYGFNNAVPEEDNNIRNALDESLIKHSKIKSFNGKSLYPCETIAGTIFPNSLWNQKANQELLYERFNRQWPVIKKNNRLGHYFDRLIAYGRSDTNEGTNQLRHIINNWQNNNHRRSALQASVFDPNKDHKKSRQLGFPCLQHVVFVPIGNNGLGIVGFYATQYIFDRAYGNYLGLCRLGKFMAHEMDLELKQMTCFTSIGMRGNTTKTKLADLRDTIHKIVPQ